MKKLKYTKFLGINQDGNGVWSMEEKQQYKFGIKMAKHTFKKWGKVLKWLTKK